MIGVAFAGLMLSEEAAVAAKLPPYPTAQQVASCARAVTSTKPLTAAQVRGCKAAVWQTYGPEPCPKDPTNPLDTQYVGPSGYTIDLGHGYRGVKGKAAHEWAIRAGHRAFQVSSATTQEQILSAIC